VLVIKEMPLSVAILGCWKMMRGINILTVRMKL